MNIYLTSLCYAGMVFTLVAENDELMVPKKSAETGGILQIRLPV